MSSMSGGIIGKQEQSADYAPLLKWLIVCVLIAFGVLALWYFGLIDEVLRTDTTHMSTLIVAVFVLGSLHCLYQTVWVSKELIAARKVRAAIGSGETTSSAIVTGDGDTLAQGVVARHIANLRIRAKNQKGGTLDQTVLLRSLGDRLRSREKLGNFLSESLLRLALLGTAVGFILMLIPIAALNSFEVEALRQTLSGMTGGMAIALSVTVTGIGTALLLKAQYFLLDGAMQELFTEAAEISEVHVVPLLERKADV